MSQKPALQEAIEGEVAKFDLLIPEHRARALLSAARLVASVDDVTIRWEYTKWLAALVGVEIFTVKRVVEQVA